MRADIQKVTLSNGLRVVMLPYDGVRTVSLGIWIGSGTRYETAEIGGVSHFIEHMLFKGTHSRTAFDIAEQVDAVGANLNAFTSKQYTCFYAKTMDTALDTVSDVLFDMITDPLFADNDIETEKGVVCEEIGMYEDSPEDVMTDGMFAGIWQGSMLGSNILGTRQTVGGMNEGILRDYMSRRYTPSRMVIAVAGHFEPDRVLSQIEGYFGTMPAQMGGMEDEAAHYHRSINLFKRDFEQTNVSIAFPADCFGSPNRYVINVFNNILGGSSSSRLFQQIREKMGLAYSVGSSYIGYLNEGMFAIDAGVNAKSEEAALLAIKDVLMQARTEGFTLRELERAKTQLKSSIVMGLESSAAKISHMGRSELLENSIKTEEEMLSGIDMVTLDGVNNLAQRYIDFSACSLSAVGKSIHDEDFYKKILL